MEIEFLHNLELYPLPYSSTYINENTDEVGYEDINSTQFVLENLSIGEYSISVYLDEFTQMEFCASVEENLDLLTEISVVSSPCCSGEITVSILEEFDNYPQYRLFTRDGQNEWIVIGERPILNSLIHIDNLCAKRYVLEISSNDCSGYLQTISLSSEVPEPELLGINHVQVCVEGTTDDFNSLDGEIHIDVESQSDFTVKWYKDGGGISIGEGESITDLSHGTYTAKVYLDGTNCLLTEGEYTICCCSQNDNSDCVVDVNEPVILGDVTNASNSISFDGSVEITFVEGSNVGLIYNWSGPNFFQSTEESLYNLEPGIYIISFTLGCAVTHSRSFIVGNEELCVNANISTTSEIKCALNPSISSGLIDLIVMPQDEYIFQWSDGSFGENLNSLTEGLYTVTVTNSYGCTAVNSYLLESTELPLEANVELSVPTGCQTQMEILGEVIIESGNPPFAFQWSTGSIESISNKEVDSTYI